MTFLNAALLLGLGAALIPPVVHLFNRRRADAVDWAAMQFLRLVPAARRRRARTVLSRLGGPWHPWPRRG